ncbi:class I SAM-dependent methyltransferase [Nocardioides zeicaulis]|uniref:Class I SAM-dependent methyltransferase n=1 Tax=Nocardioides zeicaulis TaxID=1776857 RepID=A0ABV6DWW3_9ACTN
MADEYWLRATRESYDRVSVRYADVVAEGLKGQAFEDRLLDYFANDIQRSGGGPVLDAGCGPGVLTRDLRSRGLDAYGFDVSTSMLKLAAGDDGSARVFGAALTAIPLQSASIAGLFCWYVLHHVPDQDLLGSLTELARVTRPGGLIMIGGHTGEGSYIKTAGYGGTPMRVWFVRRPAKEYADLLSQCGLQMEATVELGAEQPATNAVWFARKPE